MDGVTRRREMVQKSEGGRLPAGYTEVEYLHNSASSSSTQSYINMVVTFNNPTEAAFFVDFQEDTTSTLQYQYPIGTRQKNTGNTNSIGYGIRLNDDHKTMITYSGISASYTASETFARHKMTATWRSNRVTIQEEGQTAVTASGTTRAIGGYPICLFALKHAVNATGGTPYGMKGNIFSAKAWQDGTLIMDAVPCKRDSDNKPGFYDLVANEFRAPYGNYITAGPEV